MSTAAGFSELLATGEFKGAWLLNGFLLTWTALAVILVFYLRIPRPSSIRGPERLGERESVAPLVFTMLAGLLVWQMTAAAYLAHLGDAPKKKVTTTSVSATSASAPPTRPSPTAVPPSQAIIMAAAMNVTGIGTLFICSLIWRPGGLRRLGIDRRMFYRAWPYALVGAIIILPLVLWVNLGTEFIWQKLHIKHPHEHELLQAVSAVRSPWVIGVMVFTVTVLAPAFEELFFRGHLQTLLGRGLGPWPAVLIASAAFALVHPFWMMPPIFFLAIALGYAYERTGNLWVSIIIHGLFNGSQTALFFLVRQ